MWLPSPARGGKSSFAMTKKAIDRSPKPNAPRYVKEALRWLRSNAYQAVLTDKDGGFCLVKTESMACLLNEKLQAPTHTPIYATNFDTMVVVNVTKRILTKIEKEGDLENFMAHYMRDIRCQDHRRFFSKILMTIKTHKEPGDVALRVLHSGTGHPFALLQKHLASVLRKRSKHLAHICRSSAEIAEKLKALRIPIRFRRLLRFCKLDVKDFYMCGSPEQLSSSLFKHVQPSELSEAYKECLIHMLSNQVVFNNYDNTCYRVHRGSGMGQVISGDVADLKLNDLMEEDWAAKEEIQREHNVFLYARYRDDIIIVYAREPLGDQNNIVKFVRGMQQRAKSVYVVKAESNGESCNFLDIELFLPRDFSIKGPIEFRPYTKPTAQELPLTWESQHAPEVAWGWPLAEVCRLHRLSCNYAEFQAALRSKLAFFE